MLFFSSILTIEKKRQWFVFWLHSNRIAALLFIIVFDYRCCIHCNSYIFFFVSFYRKKKKRNTHQAICHQNIEQSSEWLSFGLMIQLVFQSHGTINSLQYYEHCFFLLLFDFIHRSELFSHFNFFSIIFFFLFSRLRGKSETVENCSSGSYNSRQQQQWQKETHTQLNWQIIFTLIPVMIFILIVQIFVYKKEKKKMCLRGKKKHKMRHIIKSISCPMNSSYNFLLTVHP